MADELDPSYRRLKDYRFPEILLTICNSAKTGIFHLKNWPAVKKIYIKKGKIIFASSNVEEDCLGISLLSGKKITVAQYYESIRLIEKTGKRHGAILVELGYITEKELENAIKNQVEGIVLSIFLWEDGYFFFEEAPFTLDEQIMLNVDAIDLIYKGIKKIDSFPHIRNALPLNTVLALSPESTSLFKKFRLNETESRIIALVDGKKTVLDILTSIREDNLETLKVLYALGSMRALVPINITDAGGEIMLATISEVKTPEVLYKRGVEYFINGKFSASADIFREAINLRPDRSSYYFYLAMSLINISMFKEAEDALITAIELEPFNDDYYAELGMVYSKQGIYEKACKTFEFALRINPHNERAQHALSEIRK